MKSKMKKLGFQNDAKIAVHKPLPYLRVQAMAIFNLLPDCGERKIVVPSENSAKKLSSNNFYSSKSLTYFEELKHGLPRYQNKHQQITNQTKSDCTIQQETNGF